MFSVLLAMQVDSVDFKASKSKILAILRSNTALQQAMPLKALTMDELWDDVSMHMHGATLHKQTHEISPLGPLRRQMQVTDLDIHMPHAIKKADMRLVLVSKFLTWTRLRVYEELKSADFESIPYADTTDAMWGKTLLLSWRWHVSPKPEKYLPGFSPMSQHQMLWLQAYMELQIEKDVAIEYVWIDWCCVPQYSSSSMIEVGRSKVG
jgi:hypothetical protein